MARAAKEKLSTPLEASERDAKLVGSACGPEASQVSRQLVYPERWMLLVLIEEAQRFQEALLVGRGEADERLKELERDLEDSMALRYAVFLLRTRRMPRGSLPVSTISFRSFQESRYTRPAFTSSSARRIPARFSGV